MRFKQTALVLGCCAVLLSLYGCCCNQARIVSQDGMGGVIAMPDNSNHWPTYNAKHAEELMQAACPQGYTIVRQEEVVVGQTQHTHVDTQRTGNAYLAALHIDPVNEHTTQTTAFEDKKEWRIYFQAKGATPTAIVPTAASVGAASQVPPTVTGSAPVVQPAAYVPMAAP